MSKKRSGGRDPEREKLWRDRVAAWQASGMTARAFCREHGLGENSFYSWRRELRRRDGAAEGTQTSARSRKPPKFVAVTVTPPEPDGGAMAVEIVLPDSTQVRVSRHAEISAITNVLRALREAPAC